MIYIKGKQNKIITNAQLIPHNKNFADAMYGFVELGEEIFLYDNLYKVKDNFKNDDIIIDYIDQVVWILNKFKPNFKNYTNYPEELNEFYGRKIWKDTINHFSSDDKLWSKGYFIKPLEEKAFTGRVVKSIKDMVGCGREDKDLEIYVSEPKIFLQEWRGFIYYDELFDLRPYLYYDGGEPDREVINKIMEKWITIKDRPNACSIDIGIDDKGKTYIVEVNDCIALGDYGLVPTSYARMIAARQRQILGIKDEFHFGQMRPF